MVLGHQHEVKAGVLGGAHLVGELGQQLGGAQAVTHHRQEDPEAAAGAHVTLLTQSRALPAMTPSPCSSTSLIVAPRIRRRPTLLIPQQR